MEQPQIKDFDRIVLSLALPFVLIAFPFLHVYANNVTNLQLPMSAFIGVFGSAILAIAVGSFVLLKLLPRAGQIWFIALTAYLMVLVWLQTNFFIGAFGFLTGETPDWQIDRGTQILQSVFLVVLLLGMLWLRDTVSSNISFMVGLIALSSMAYVPSLLEKSNRVENTKYSFNRTGVFEFSRAKNVVIFVLDSAQADVVYEVLEKNPEIKEKYRGFTLFRNSVSNFPKTYASIPSLLTGEAYDNAQPLHDYLKQVYLEKSLAAQLTDNGFDSRLLSSSPHALLAHPSVAANVSDNTGNAVSSSLLTDEAETLANLMLFRVSPHLLKPAVYNDGEFRISIDRPKTSSTAENCSLSEAERDFSKERRSFDNVFLDEFAKCTQISMDQPALKFYHLYAPHAPYQADETFAYIGSKPLSRQWFSLQTQGILSVVGNLLTDMEAKGLMDNSLIIITSDHGEGEYNVGINYPENLPKETGSGGQVGQNIVRGGIPLMMASRPEDRAGALQISDVPVQLTDVPATVYDWLGMENTTPGKSIFSIEADESRTRYHRYYQFAGWNIDYIIPLTEYAVDGFSWYESSWSRSGRTFDQGIANSFEGEFLTLSRTGNFDERVHTGWTTPGKVARGITESGAVVVLRGTGQSLLTAKHALYSKEDAIISLFQDGEPIGNWTFAKNDGQRAKTLVLDVTGEFELGLQTTSGNGRNVRFRELRLEPVTAYTYELGTPINFTDLGNSSEYRTYGWSRTEFWGTSSIGHASGVIVTLDPSINEPLRVDLTLSGYVFERWPAQEVELFANDTLIGNLTLTDRKRVTYTFDIGPDVISNAGVLDFTFNYRTPLRQSEHGISGDTRLQAIAMVEMTVNRAKNAPGS